MSQALLGAITAPWIVPLTPQPDMAVGMNFQHFSGVYDPVLDHPASSQDPTLVFGSNTPGAMHDYPRPGQFDQIQGQVYTPSPLTGLANTLGAGQAAMPAYGPAGAAVYRPPGVSHVVNAPSVQWKLGVGQRGPAELGVAQTLQLSSITGNPPIPGDLSSILSGQG